MLNSNRQSTQNSSARGASTEGSAIRTQCAFAALLVGSLIASGCASVELYPPGPVTRNFSKESCLSLTLPKEPVCSSNDTLENGINCATTTRDNYGVFLECRESRQLVAGATVAMLAAGAAGVAAASVSAAGAAALGASAGAGLALDYATYNKVKTKAYSDAIMQLQCVISKSEPLQGKLAGLPDVRNDLTYGANDDNLRNAKLCLNSNRSDASLLNLAAAKYDLAKQHETAARDRLALMNVELVEAVDSIDVRAFAEAQSGVPDAAQIEQAVKSVNSAMPSTKAPPAAGAQPQAEKQAVKAPANCGDIDHLIQSTTELTSRLNKAVADLKLPEKGYTECLALKTQDNSTSGKSTSSKSSSTTKSGSSGKTANTSSASSAADGNNADSSSSSKPSDQSEPQPKPDKIAFQVLPADVVSVDKSKSTTLKLIGGAPPYHWSVVDDDLYVETASQTDLFVTIEVKWSADAGEHRLLVSDQDGAEVVVYMNQSSSTTNTTAGGKTKASASGGKKGGSTAGGGKVKSSTASGSSGHAKGTE